MKKNLKLLGGISILFVMIFASTACAAVENVGIAVDDTFSWTFEITQGDVTNSTTVDVTIDKVADEAVYDTVLVNLTSTIEGDNADGMDLIFGALGSVVALDQEMVDSYVEDSFPLFFIGTNLKLEYESTNSTATYTADGVLKSAEITFYDPAGDLSVSIKLGGGIPGFPAGIVSLMSIVGIAAIIIKKRK